MAHARSARRLAALALGCSAIMILGRGPAKADYKIITAGGVADAVTLSTKAGLGNLEQGQMPVTTSNPHEAQLHNEHHKQSSNLSNRGAKSGRYLTGDMHGDDTQDDVERINMLQHSPSASSDITCPFFRTLVNMRSIPIQERYAKEQLVDITADSGLDRETAQAHADSNFKHSTSNWMDLFSMEGQANEHVTSTGCCDCDTSFLDCHTSAGLKQCNSKTLLCKQPRFNESMAFFNVADRDKDGILTIAEVEESQDKFPFNDANPIGETTIAVAFSMLIKVFGEWLDRMSRRAFIDVVVFATFPEHYEYPFPRPVFVQQVLFRPPDSEFLLLEETLADQTGQGNRITSEPVGIVYSGAGVQLQGHRLTASHSHSLDDLGTRIHRNAFTVAVAVKLESIAGNASTVLVKKGRGLRSPANESGWTAGWGLGHEFSTRGLSYVARDHVGRCEGLLLFDGSQDWELHIWTHIAVIFDRSAGEVSLWLNGQKQDSTGSLRDCRGSWANTEDLEIGNAYGREMHGEMKEFAIFNGTASPEQIFNWSSGRF